MAENTVPSKHPSDAVLATKQLTLLVVEDDVLNRKMMMIYLGKFFKQIIVATDGNDGFQRYCEHRPDIVLTDQMMPDLSGLGLLRKIRETGEKTPVVLMTCSTDNQVLQEAINTGVHKFIAKPIDFELTSQILNSIAQEILYERLMEQHRLQEVELLRYRDAYNSMQQEAARRKERHVVCHDLHHKILKGAGGVRWGMNALYTPRDIMCGDGYSVRHLFDGRQLVFIVDAMGSGMSASLTAMLTTSFCNYQVANLHLWGNFSLQQFLKRFQEYLACMLLEEEVLSCGFLLIDLEKEEVEAAFFGLPPLLVRGLDGSIRKIRGENPPLGIFPYDIRISTLSLSEVASVLAMTDGVTDALLDSGGPYREELERDYHEAPTIAALKRRFMRKTTQDERDDLTFLHLLRLDVDSGWSWSAEPEPSLEALSRTGSEFLDALSLAAVLSETERDELEVILTEALTNALEHGCLRIDREEKTRLQLTGEYEDTLANRTVAPDASITLSASLWNVSTKPLLIMEIKDNGPGVPDEALLYDRENVTVNGRGFKLIKHYSDFLLVENSGGHLIILKTLEGNDYATTIQV